MTRVRFARKVQDYALARCGGKGSRGRGISCNGEPVDRGHGPLELWRARPAHNPSALTRSNSLITAEHHRTSIVQQRGRDHGKGNSRAYYVADHMIDARSHTGTARTNKRQYGIQPARQSLITDAS